MEADATIEIYRARQSWSNTAAFSACPVQLGQRNIPKLLLTPGLQKDYSSILDSLLTVKTSRSSAVSSTLSCKPAQDCQHPSHTDLAVITL